jgi:hypothetical protein
MNKLLLLLLLLMGCTPYPSTTSATRNQSRKNLLLADQVYENTIKTARVFPVLPSPMMQMQPAVTRMGEWNLVLEFDELRSDQDSYYIRLVHCNQNWTKSPLMDLDFLNDYNEFPINNFEYSLDTWFPYVHYWVMLPPVKLPGNYVAVVYRGADRNDIILSKRFLVYDSRVVFKREDNQITSGSAAMQNQQINFTVNYRNFPLINPIETVNVSIRQNQRWDNIAQEIKPSFVREASHELEYRFFADTDLIKGGNEFRFFDLRSVNFPGRNVAYMDKARIPWTAYIEKDKTRMGEPYSQYEDINGNFMLDNYDFRITNAAQYLNVAFTLNSPQPVNGEVYVAGSFTDWRKDETTRMQYDSASRAYTAQFLIKQGWYDYHYSVESKTLTPFHFEGTHFQTENMYEIFVYYREFQRQIDILIGYLRFEKNPRLR